jgi:uncharacterized protein (TIGR02996 family)
MARRRSRRDPTRDALLAAVAAEPEDDAPRLVMADWLEENGDPFRAEFIRAQLEVRRLDLYTARSAALRRRVEELHKKHGKRWLKDDGLDKLLFPVFRRGFVEQILFDDCAAFLRDAPGLAERTPLLAAEVLCETPEPEQAFIDSPLLERLRGLHVCRRASMLLLSRQLLRSPGGGEFLRMLQEERFEEVRRAALAEPDPPGLRALLLSPRLTNLRELDLSGSWFEPGLISVFRDVKPLANLRSLDLTDTSFPESDFAHIAESPHLANLRELYLCGADSVPGFHQEGAAILAGSPYLRRLEVLNVRSQHLERAGFEALARWPGRQPPQARSGIDGRTRPGLRRGGAGAGVLAALERAARAERRERRAGAGARGGPAVVAEAGVAAGAAAGPARLRERGRRRRGRVDAHPLPVPGRPDRAGPRQLQTGGGGAEGTGRTLRRRPDRPRQAVAMSGARLTAGCRTRRVAAAPN